MSCLIKDSIRTVLPCCLDGCSCLPISVSVKEIWFLVKLWWASGRIAMTFGRMQPWTIHLLDTDGRPDAWLGHPDGRLGSNFSDLESAQNLLLSILNHFLKWRLRNKTASLWKQQHYMIVILSTKCNQSKTNTMDVKRARSTSSLNAALAAGFGELWWMIVLLLILHFIGMLLFTDS
jgi:hypothetical protein